MVQVSTASTPVARAGVQLLYANVDRVVDGRETSGWQLMACEPAIADDLRERLLTHIRPELDLVVPLPDFPTPQEEAAADRRLTQVLTVDGTVLAHTAPAGPDTTGRANTMSHLILLAAEPAPAQATADLWRSPAWSTPVGAQAVRQARVSAPDAFLPGTVVTEETVAAFITQAGCGPVLAYIADLLDERLRARVTGERVDGATLVLPVQSTDEAALWIGALQRTCAPATARLLGYTTFARAAAPLEVDALASSGLDLVCVPASDRLDVVDQHPDTALVTAQAAAAHTLTTAWGVLVAAMSRDLGTWQGARSAMRDLLSFLTVHTDLSPAWPLAMVEASDAGILGVSDGHLDTTVDLELVACQPSGLAGAAYLSSLVAERILGASQSDPAHWWDKLSVVPRDVPATGVVAGLAEKYLNSAVQDAAWLLRRERHDDEDAERSLAQWSTSSQGCAVLPDLAGRLIATLEAAGAAGARERLAAVGNLVRDGVVLDETVEMRLLAPVAQAFMTADGSALAEPSLPSALRAGVCRLLGDLLVGEYRFHTVPSLAPQVCDWLAPVATASPHVALEVAASRLLVSFSPQREAEQWRQAMDAVVGLERGDQVATSPQLQDQVARYVAPAAMPPWQQLWQSWSEAAAACALYHAGQESATALAQQVLVAKNHPPSQPLGATYAYVSTPTAAATVAWLHPQPLFSLAAPTAVGWACATLLATHSLARTQEPLMQCRAVTDECDRALAILALAAVQGLRPGLPGDLSTVAARLQQRSVELVEVLDSHPQLLHRGTDLATGELVDGALRALADAENARTIVEQAASLAPRVEGSRQHVAAAASVLGGLVPDPVALAKAAIRARVRMLGEAGVEAVHRAIHTAYVGYGIQGMDTWCDKQVLGTSSRGLRGLFQRR